MSFQLRCFRLLSDTVENVDGYVAEAEKIRLEYLSRNSAAAGQASQMPVSAPAPPIRATVQSSAVRPTAQSTPVVVPPKTSASVSVTVRPSAAVEPPPRSTGRFTMNASGPTMPRVVTASAGSQHGTRVNGQGSNVKPDDAPIPYIPPPAEFASGSPTGAATPVSATLRSVSRPSQSNSVVFTARRPSSGESASAAGRTVVWPPKSYSERNIDTWSAEEVGEWLEKLDLGDYRAAFTEHGVTGKVLKNMSESDYEKYGVSLPIARMKLQREVRSASKVN